MLRRSLICGVLLLPLAAWPATAPAQSALGLDMPSNASAGQFPRLLSRAQDPIERRVQVLHDRLRITPAQQPQWDAFANTIRANARHMSAVMEEQRQRGSAPISATEDMRLYARLTQAHAEDVQKLVGPFEALYAVMSPDQQRLADQAFRDFQDRENRMRARRG